MKAILFSLALILFAADAMASVDTLPTAPYQRFPTVPPFKIMLPNNATYFTKDDLPKKKAVMMMVFSPDCEHCQHEIEEIIKRIDEFKQVQIVMATLLPIERVQAFYIKYDLKRFDNIVVGKDANYLLPGFYNVHNLPFLAFYNKKKDLISVFEGNLGVTKILAELKK